MDIVVAARGGQEGAQAMRSQFLGDIRKVEGEKAQRVGGALKAR
jgi:hypothetical protein